MVERDLSDWSRDVSQNFSCAYVLALIREESQYYRSSAKGQGVFINHAASNSNLQL